MFEPYGVGFAGDHLLCVSPSVGHQRGLVLVGLRGRRFCSAGADVAFAQLANVVDEFGGFEDVEVEVEHADIGGDGGQAVGAGDKNAVVVVRHLDHADAGVDACEYRGGGGGD